MYMYTQPAGQVQTTMYACTTSVAVTQRLTGPADQYNVRLREVSGVTHCRHSLRPCTVSTICAIALLLRALAAARAHGFFRLPRGGTTSSPVPRVASHHRHRAAWRPCVGGRPPLACNACRCQSLPCRLNCTASVRTTTSVWRGSCYRTDACARSSSPS